MPICIYIYIYIAYCLLPICIYIYIAYCLLQWQPWCWLQGQWLAVVGFRSAGDHELEVGFMRHGHEMLWFLRLSFSESELPLSYNAKVTNARIQLIGYEINLLNKV